MKICKNLSDYEAYRFKIKTDGAFNDGYEIPHSFPCIVSFDLCNFYLDGNITSPIVRRQMIQHIIYVEDLKKMFYEDDFKEILK